MRSPLFLVVVLLSLLAAVLAVKIPQKSVVISFPSTTPDHFVQSAKEAVEQAGGIVTHSFKLFKGFAATVQQKGLDAVSALSTDPQYQPTIEEDQIVTVQ